MSSTNNHAQRYSDRRRSSVYSEKQLPKHSKVMEVPVTPSESEARTAQDLLSECIEEIGMGTL
jgi:hypothetical protein